MSSLTLLAGLSLLIWVYLVGFRGGYWRAAPRLPELAGNRAAWPGVAAIVPARDEADVLASSLGSLLAQDYPGRLEVVLVDDHSADGTAETARRAAASLVRASGRAEGLRIVAARDLPAGWTGKVWALAEGLAEIERAGIEADYIWLSDADIAHDSDGLRRLVAKAEGERRDLVSLMARLWCESAWERLVIPPFVYFFQMLYPFAWVNDPARRTAGAAGGCVLVRRAALGAIGGFAAIQGELIDDCALARRIKDLGLRGDPAAAGGGIWLGLTSGARSLRPYDGLAGIWRMVARTAYTQLRHSPLLLAGTLAGLALTYLVPPLGLLLAPWHGEAMAATMAGVAWAIMAATAWPTFRAYAQPPWRALALPLAAALYGAMTFDSAWRHWRGAGGTWKGRVQAAPGALARRGPGL